jgi:hypothetical protein
MKGFLFDFLSFFILISHIPRSGEKKIITIPEIINFSFTIASKPNLIYLVEHFNILLYS